MAHLKVLAADAMEGRGLGQPGLARALDYAESVMVAAGLEPAFRDPRDKPTYRQEVPIARYRLGPGNRAVLDRAGQRHELTHPTEMLVLRPGRRPGTVRAELAFLGYGIQEPALGRDDYAGVDARGKWAVLLEGHPDDMTPELAAIYGNEDASSERILAAALEAKVAGLIIVMSPQVYESWDILSGMHSETAFAATRSYVGGAQADTDIPVLALAAEQVEILFDGTGCDPIARTGIERSFVLPKTRLTVTTDAERSIVRSHNLAGVVRGNEALEEFVTLTAHIDHLGLRNGEIFNGANDDASGCAVVLAAAFRLQQMNLRRSVMCVLFTGEESGHFGSLHFLAQPPAGRLLAGVNLEHVGRSADKTFLTTASLSLLPVVQEVAAEHGEMRTASLDAEGALIRGSDSYSYFLHGLPLVILGGGGFPQYHGTDDDISLIDERMLERALDLSLALIGKLAGLPGGE